MTAPAASGRAAPARLPHVPALDGLRGVAVVGVLAFHAGHLSGGFLGVDLFFVLSGFLITTLLLIERDADGRISLAGFWGRRARRLLPALFAVIAASTVVMRIIGRPDELDRFAQEALAALFYVANWQQLSAGGDYWALFDSPSPLEHLWSLAIEEQFYVAWPLIVTACLVVVGGRRWVLAALSAGGLVGSIVLLNVLGDAAEGTTRAYYGTDTRAASILFGAGLAIGTAGRRRVAGWAESSLSALAVPAVVALGYLWVVADGTDAWLYDWGLPVHGLLGAVVIAVVAGPSSGPVGRVLEMRPIRAAGDISYGLYLWHWPVYVVLDQARTGLDGWTLTAARVAVSLAVSVASYHLLEQPIRRGRVSFRWPTSTTIAAAAAVAVFVVVVADGPATADRVEVADTVAGRVRPAAIVAEEPEHRILVVGDSGAATLAPAFEAVAPASGVVVRDDGQVGCGLPRRGGGVTAADGTFFADPADCERWPSRWGDAVDEFDPDVAVLVLAWGGVGDRDIGGRVAQGPCDPEFDALYAGELRRAIRVLGADGAQVLVATSPPHGFDRSADDRSKCLNDIYRSIAEAEDDAAVLDLAAWTCLASACMAGPDADRPDGVHFEGDAAIAAAEWIIQESLRIAGLDDTSFVVLVGDSQAFRLVEDAPTPDDLGLRVGGWAALGCGLHGANVVIETRPVSKDDCEEFVRRTPAEVDRLEPDLVLIHVGAWEALDVEVGGDTLRFPSPEWRDHLHTTVGAAISELAGHQRVAVLTTPCFGEGPGRAALGAGDLDDRVAAVNEALIAAAEANNLPLVDYAEFLCPGGEARSIVDGVMVRPDGVHAEEAGARVVWQWLAEQIEPLLRRP